MIIIVENEIFRFEAVQDNAITGKFTDAPLSEKSFEDLKSLEDPWDFT